jgi:AraC-like DNA-binding protein
VEGLAVDVRTATFRAFDYACGPGEPAWRDVNVTGDAWVLAFPHRQVGIAPRVGPGAGEVLADPGLAMLYAPRQEYRRRLVDPRGDATDALAVTGERVAELSEGRPAAVSPGWLPVAAPVLLRQRLLFRRLRHGTAGATALAVTEEVTAVLAAVLGGPSPAAATARRGSTRRRHAELVEAAREVLGRDLARDLELADVARAVGAAPHHLARVFRAGTGSSLHGYRTQLRLRAAVDAVLDGAPVGEVAHAVGFSSHAHLTGTFRSVFGRPPSSLRSLPQPR